MLTLCRRISTPTAQHAVRTQSATGELGEGIFWGLGIVLGGVDSQRPFFIPFHLRDDDNQPTSIPSRQTKRLNHPRSCHDSRGRRKWLWTGGKRETDIRGGGGGEENARMFSRLASHSDAAISIRASFPSPLHYLHRAESIARPQLGLGRTKAQHTSSEVPFFVYTY